MGKQVQKVRLLQENVVARSLWPSHPRYIRRSRRKLCLKNKNIKIHNVLYKKKIVSTRLPVSSFFTFRSLALEGKLYTTPTCFFFPIHPTFFYWNCLFFLVEYKNSVFCSSSHTQFAVLWIVNFFFSYLFISTREKPDVYDAIQNSFKKIKNFEPFHQNDTITQCMKTVHLFYFIYYHLFCIHTQHTHLFLKVGGKCVGNFIF